MSLSGSKPSPTPANGWRRERHGRSPSERAFDFVAFPNLGFALLLAVAFSFQATTVPDLTAAAVGAKLIIAAVDLLHWAAGARLVYRAWNDPFGCVLRWSSTLLLTVQLLIVLLSLLVSPPTPPD
jgi:hypothetical protein